MGGTTAPGESMLTKDEETQVRELFSRVAHGGQVQAAEMATILARLPRKTEALEMMRDLARSQGLPWVEYLSKTIHAIRDSKSPDDSMIRPPTGCLADLLRSAEPYPRKVEALMAAQRGGDPELLQVVREFMPGEPDPFVLATMAAVLGQRGDDQDRELLMGALGNPDFRVVANVLEAIYRLKLRVPLSKVQHLLDSPDNRVKMNALAVFTLINPIRALDMLKALAAQPGPQVRGAAAFLLGELSEAQPAIELLVSMLEAEENTAVLKQIAFSLKKLGGRTNLTELLGPLYSRRVKASGAKRSVLEMMLFTIASGTNLTSQQVQEIGEAFIRAGEGRQPDGRLSLARPTVATPVLPALVISAHGSPAVTEVTETLGSTPETPVVTAAPPVPAPASAAAEIEEPDDEPLSFTGVWGPAAAQPALTTTGYFNTADVLGSNLPSGATSSKTPSRKIAQAQVDSAAISLPSLLGQLKSLDKAALARFRTPALWLLVGCGALGMVAGVLSFASSEPAATQAAVKPHGKKEKPQSRLAAGGGPEGAAKLDRIDTRGPATATGGPGDSAGEAGSLGGGTVTTHGTPGRDPKGAAAARDPSKTGIHRTGAGDEKVTVEGSPPVDLSRVLGPAGAPIQVKGTVVGVTCGRPLLESRGHHYLVVKGKVPEEIRRGDELKVNGKILGSSRHGVVYVEGS